MGVERDVGIWENDNVSMISILHLDSLIIGYA